MPGNWSCFHCLPALHFGHCSSALRLIIVMVFLSWLGTLHSSAVSGTKSVLLPSSGTLGLILAGSGAQDSCGPVLWGGTKDPFSGLCLMFLLSCICSSLSWRWKWICPAGFHLSLKPGEQLSHWAYVRAYVTQSLSCYYCHLGNNCLVSVCETDASW